MPVLQKVNLTTPVELRRASLQYAALHYHDGVKPKQIQLGPGVTLPGETFGLSWDNRIIDVPVVNRPDLPAGHLRIDSEVWTPANVHAGHSWDGRNVPATA